MSFGPKSITSIPENAKKYWGSSLILVNSFTGLETSGPIMTNMVQLSDWQVVEIYDGLSKCNCRVIWSLKENTQQCLPSSAKSNRNFWVASWLPQPAILLHTGTAAVVTHCGWGGCLEVINAGKPVLAFPFFGDQTHNAEMLIKAGMAIMSSKPTQLIFVPENLHDRKSLCAATV